MNKKMKIVVIGGSGLIGTKVVNNLRQQGHAVVAASPSSGVNTVTGEGLADALSGAQVVVDVVNSPSFEDKAALEFFETSGHNLLTAEATPGVGHHVALSVVGTERLLASGYFRARWPRTKWSHTLNAFRTASMSSSKMTGSWSLPIPAIRALSELAIASEAEKWFASHPH